jgi:hypothetical protein
MAVPSPIRTASSEIKTTAPPRGARLSPALRARYGLKGEQQTLRQTAKRLGSRLGLTDVSLGAPYVLDTDPSRPT